MANCFLRLGSVQGKKLLPALCHNKRSTQARLGASLNIDPKRSHLNYNILDALSPNEIQKQVRVLLAQSDITPRKNAVMAVEVLFCLPITWHQEDSKTFFVDCFEWAKRVFDGILLSFDVHLDESAPHAHALIFPLIEGKLQGNKLMGDRTHLRALNERFYIEVGSRYGFSRAKILTSQARGSLERQVLERLGADAVKRSQIWSLVRDDIRKNPQKFASLLGIEASTDNRVKPRSFVEIMTTPVYSI